jgi:pyruvate dehydrogenase E1 component alpha subunit/2-oxoisovalerate dehydrogenase E1 component alpha subunit
LPAGLERHQLGELYYYMRLTRSLEERLVNLKRQMKIAGGVYRSLGQEADTVGSAYALDRSKGDIACPMIRNLGAILVQGASVTDILRQNMAKGTAPSRGREQSFHYADLEKGFIGHIANLGDMIPVMAGVALSFRLRNEGRVTLVYSGDGMMSTGSFHEGLNFAAVQRLPMVVVCENNGYAYSTPTRTQTRVEWLHYKAAAYGITGVLADGNDVIAVYQVTRDAVERARRGEGVTLIELVTYRRTGHAEHDNQAYVPADEVAQWERKDPIAQFTARALNNGWLAAQELEATDRQIAATLDSAIAQVEAEPQAPASFALGEVYASPSTKQRSPST